MIFQFRVLGIYESDSTGFLGQVDVSELESAVMRLKKGDYEVDGSFQTLCEGRWKRSGTST